MHSKNKSFLSIKKENFHKKTVSQFRQAYKKEVRKLFQIEKVQEFCFRSETFQNFNFLQNNSSIQIYFSQLFDILLQLNIQEMPDQQADNLARDLLYLIIEKDFICPYQLKLKKNQSQFSALVIAIVSDKIDPQQLKCWINIMNQQFRIVMYLAVIVENQSSRIWIQETFFLQQLLSDWDLLQVPNLLYRLLTQSFYVNEQFIHLVNQKLINKIKKVLQNHQRNGFIAQEMQMLLYLIRLFIKNQSLGTRILELYLNELIEKLTQTQLSKIFTQNTVNMMQKYIQQTSESLEISLIQQNFIKLVKVFADNLKKEEYKLIDNKFSQKIFVSNIKMILNIILHYLRVNNLRKTGFKFRNAQTLQKLNPHNIKKELTQECLQMEIQKLDKIYTKILNYENH